MRKYTIAAAILAIAVATTLAFGQSTKSTVIGTVHDIASAGCASCHAPHNGALAAGGAQTTGQILLWDRGFTTVTFGTYDSPSLDNTPAEIGTTTPLATDPRLFSFLCMSCHDGVTSPTLIGPAVSEAVGNLANSAGLTNDHPINMTYDDTADTEQGLHTLATVQSSPLLLFGATNTVQCGSCHNAHDDTNTPFLRVSNTGSALCTTCHL